ncbi:MAG: Hpt domain-containing protein [Spirochaetaceae bacterium]|nr:Hpt domain-containing protein [Spirochaetaceae bacterium]MBR6566047.1 Hpt domain-containing protein [Spirochaetaceae bacterium]
MENGTSNLIDLREALDRLDDDMGLYMILVDAFLQDTVFKDERLRELEVAFRRSNSKESLEAAQYIHRLKGAARQLGANPLAAEAQKLEDIFRNKGTVNLQDTETLVEVILDLHKKTVEELRKLSQ